MACLPEKHSIHVATGLAGVIAVETAWRRGSSGIDVAVAACAWLLVLLLAIRSRRGEMAAGWRGGLGAAAFCWWTLQSGRLAEDDLSGAMLLPPLLLATVWLATMPSGPPCGFHLRTFVIVASLGISSIRVGELAGAGQLFAELHAQLGGFVLHYLGFDAAVSGEEIRVGASKVLVHHYCTGGPLIAGLAKIALLLAMAFGMRPGRLAALIALAFACGLAAGVGRVALMAWANSADERLFNWLHGEAGGALFTAAAILAFFPALRQEEEMAFAIFDRQKPSPDGTPAELRRHGAAWALPAVVIAALACGVAWSVVDGKFGRRPAPPAPGNTDGWDPIDLPEALSKRIHDRATGAWRIPGPHGAVIARIAMALSGPETIVADKDFANWLAQVRGGADVPDRITAVRDSGERVETDAEWLALLKKDGLDPGRWIRWMLFGEPARVRRYSLHISSEP